MHITFLIVNMHYCIIILHRGEWSRKFKTIRFKGREGTHLEQTHFRYQHGRESSGPHTPGHQHVLGAWPCPHPSLQPPSGWNWETDHWHHGWDPQGSWYSPKGKNHRSVWGLRAQAGVEAWLHAVVNESPNFSKSRFSHLPNVVPQLAECGEDDVLAQHGSTHVDCCVKPLSRGFWGCFLRVWQQRAKRVGLCVVWKQGIQKYNHLYSSPLNGGARAECSHCTSWV